MKYVMTLFRVPVIQVIYLKKCKNGQLDLALILEPLCCGAMSINNYILFH